MKKYLRTIFYLFVALAFCSAISFAQTTAVDTTFNTSAYGTDLGGNIYVIKKQPDGKNLVGGEFSKINQISKVGVARLLNKPSLRKYFI